MSTSEYRAAAVEAIRSLLGGIAQLADNRFTGPVNRRLWGPQPWLTLSALVVACTGLGLALPPPSRLMGLLPPLMALQFLPDVVRNLLWSAPTFFGFVVAWRIRSLRQDTGERWQAETEAERLRLFEAAALPVAAAAVVLTAALLLVPRWVPPPPWITAVELPGSLGASILALTNTFMVIALVAAILPAHRSLSTAIGKLMGAGFFVFAMSMAVAFGSSWMGSWWRYLPIPFINRSAPGSPWLLLSLFQLGIAAAAWIASREKARVAVFYPPVPPPDSSEE